MRSINDLFVKAMVLQAIIETVDLNNINTETFIKLEEVAEAYEDFEIFWDSLDYEEWPDEFHIYHEDFKVNWKIVYYAMAYTHGLSLPYGEYDQDYGVNNMPYLWRAYTEAWEDIDWTYRLYVPFSGMPDTSVAAYTHCHASMAWVEYEDDRYEDNYEELEITRQRSRRYA